MPKTKNEPTLVEKIEDARAQIAATEKRVGELAAELAEIPGRITSVDWSDEEKSILEVAALERRRDALPHYLKHLRRSLVEQEIAALRLEMEEAESRKPELIEREKQAREEFEQARAVHNQAAGALNEHRYGLMSDLRRGISEAEKRLHALNTEKSPEEQGPVVVSTWQQNMSRPGPENFEAAG